MVINDETQIKLRKAIMDGAATYIKSTFAGDCRVLVSMDDFGENYSGNCVELDKVTIYCNMTFNVLLWGEKYVVDTLICVIEGYELVHLGKNNRVDSLGKYLASNSV